jgi:hypothetical protein
MHYVTEISRPGRIFGPNPMHIEFRFYYTFYSVGRLVIEW